MTERDAHCSKKREFCSETLWLNAASIDVNIFSLPAEVAKLLVEATDYLKKLELNILRKLKPTSAHRIPL